MKESHFRRICTISESFCDKCFKYDKEPNIAGLDADLAEMAKIVKGKDKDTKALLLLFVERGARTSFLKHALVKTQTGEKATDGITTDNEFKSLLEHLEAKNKETDDANLISEILSHLLMEVESISSEINVTSLQSFNSVNDTYKEIEGSINERLKRFSDELVNFNKEQDAILNEFHDEMHDVEKRMHDSNITILGIFSAVVLVFNAAVGFYSSAISAFGSFTTYKTIAVLLIIGIIVVGAMMGLFYYLEVVRKGARVDINRHIRVTRKKDKQRSANSKREVAPRENIYIVEKTGVFKSLLPFLIIIVLLIAGLVSVFCFWKDGSIEVRDQEVEQVVEQMIASSAENKQQPTENKQQ